MRKILSLSVFFLLCLTAGAEDFTYNYNGVTLTYTVIDEEARTCKLKAGEVPVYTKDTPGNDVSGDVVIPSEAKYYRHYFKVIEIPTAAFSGCSGLTSVTIPDGITSIGYHAFSNCTGLTSVTIPNSVTDIGGDAFAGCTGLKEVTILNPTPPNADRSSFDDNTYKNATLYVPEEAYGTYDNMIVGPWKYFLKLKSVEPTYFFDYNDNNMTATITGVNKGKLSPILTIPATTIHLGKTYTVVAIGEEAFENCTSVTSVTIPNSVTSIGKYAFCNCNNMTSVTIPNSVKSIGGAAFSWCKSLNKVNISDIAAWCKIKFKDNWTANPLHEAHHLYLNGEEVTDLVIPNSVTSIGNLAFYGCSGLTSITIPNSIDYIGSGAFYGCGGLTEVTIPDGVIYIYNSVFEDCNGLTSVTIPNSVRSIGERAFWGCSGLTSMTIPNSVKSIDNEVFMHCRGLTSVTIPNSVTSIGSAAFYNCTGLTSIAIPNSVTSIGRNAFYGCTGLTSVAIPNSVKSLSGAFSNCTSLTSVIIPSSVTDIGDETFKDCTRLMDIYILNPTPPNINYSSFDRYNWANATLYVPQEALEAYKMADYWKKFQNIHGFEMLTFYYDYDDKNMTATVTGINKEKLSSNLVIPAITTHLGKTYTVVAIGYEAFKGCSGFTEVAIPHSVTDIGYGAFSGCSGLTGVTIPNSVAYIGDYAFSDCSSLISAIIPNSVTSIGSYAFYDCSGLTEVYSLNPAPPSTSKDPFGDIIYKEATLYVPEEAMEAYKKAEHWRNFMSIQNIEPQAFFYEYDDNNMTATVTGVNKDKLSSNLIIPEATTHLGKTYTVAAIGNAAFTMRSDLTEVTIPNSVASIGSSAFSGCSSLTKVNISDITAWCNIKFDRYYSNPLYCAHHLYLNGEEVTNLVIPDGIKSIENYAFMGCSGLTSVTIPNSVTSIVYSAFEGCTGLTSVTIPNSVGNIMDAAFSDCSSLTSITLPQSVGYIGEYAFYGSTHLKTIYSLRLAPPIIAGEKCLYNSFNDATLYVPQEALEAYKNAEYWKNFQNIKGFDPTGIKGIEADGNDKRNVYYDLNGRRLSAPKKGLNIINGKKVIVK